MKKNLTITLNWIFLMIVAVAFVILSLNFFTDSDQRDHEIECIDVNNVNSFIYDLCYDAYTKNIFMEASRTEDNYDLKEIEISFFDFERKRYSLEEVPGIGESKLYRFPADKNPQTIGVSLDIIKTFSSPICVNPRELYVRYCPARQNEGGENITINPLNGEGVGAVIDVRRSQEGSDTFSEELVSQEAIWKSQCSSVWECSTWESCDDGTQKRSCKDIVGCAIPTSKPQTTRYCDDSCTESWSCDWSPCEDGFTIPQCIDKNNCGTYNELPQKIPCGSGVECSPDIECSDWSECNVDYRFDNVAKGINEELTGIRSRICEDKNRCLTSIQKIKSCSVSVDIYTKQFRKCGVNYLQVYNLLSDELVARIDIGTKENIAMNIYFDNSGEAYCDHCFDGISSGDESGIDCGGSCLPCSEKYKANELNFNKKTSLQKFNSWLKSIFRD